MILPHDKEKELIQEAEQKGYVHNTIINSPHFKNIPLKVGFGLIWSDFQNALVCGCTYNGDYYSCVPVFENGEWVEIIKRADK